MTGSPLINMASAVERYGLKILIEICGNEGALESINPQISAKYADAGDHEYHGDPYRSDLGCNLLMGGLSIPRLEMIFYDLSTIGIAFLYAYQLLGVRC